eukprot:571093-Prorocentrum_minimum.AAC.1
MSRSRVSLRDFRRLGLTTGHGNTFKTGTFRAFRGLADLCEPRRVLLKLRSVRLAILAVLQTEDRAVESRQQRARNPHR